MSKKIIFLIGSLASGKGTQAKLLAEKTGFYRFITSKEGKKYIAEHRDDPQTLKQEELYKKGELFDPEWLLNQVQKQGVEDLLINDWLGLIFDGSPRTLYEAENLFKIVVDSVGEKNVLVFEIFVSEEEVRKRTEDRLVCDKNENHVVSIRLDNVKEGDECKKCGGVFVRRDLDKKLDERLEEYNTRTVPGIKYLKKTYPDRIITINGEQSVEKVHEDIMKLIN